MNYETGIRFGLFLVVLCLIAAVCPVVLSQTPTPDCIHMGDTNLDGEITAYDAQLAFFVTLGMYSPTFEEECAADCNGDGNVTAGDAQSIFYTVLGIGECADPLVNETPTPTQTPTATPFAGCTGGDLLSTDPIVGNMRCAPSGTFTQGSPDGSGPDPSEPCRENNETQFTHTLTRDLVVMETEITRQMWADLLAVQTTLPSDPSYMPYSPTLNHPVQNNSWYEAVLFANLLSLQNGYVRCYYTDSGFITPITSTNYTSGPFHCDFGADGYRLPTEGEWECFTRAGTTTAFSCNETNYTIDNCNSCTFGTHPVLEQFCWYCANSEYVGTQIAGNSLANPWNLKNVHGNVWEWCWDWYGMYPTGSATDYTGLTSGSFRVFRGGGFSSYADLCRSAQRDHDPPDGRILDLGFRLLRTTFNDSMLKRR